jgi:CubicO group peptidase (beta-lactamase class C family)
MITWRASTDLLQCFAEQRQILTPLHLPHTGYDQNHPRLPWHATGYAKLGTPDQYIDMSVPYAAGALYSTVRDLYRWDQALARGPFPSRKLVRAMTTPAAFVCSQVS